ncbi:hypothetical protein [Sphingomonas melonis]|uniref:hypothetical protein n=1 Tax=Sphingomonas melonis TaxID=152682 RepID=UPI000B0809ED|nr:hypothetical protein [Sphingomonas melonis]
MRLILAFAICLAAGGCDIPKPTNENDEGLQNTALDTAANGQTVVGEALLAGKQMATKLPSGETLSISCSDTSASIYVDTLQGIAKPPPLHGVMGHFVVDGKALPATELAWGVKPSSSWSAHDRKPVRPLAVAIVKAKSVSFKPPYDGRMISWKIAMPEADRVTILQACGS